MFPSLMFSLLDPLIVGDPRNLYEDYDLIRLYSEFFVSICRHKPSMDSIDIKNFAHAFAKRSAYNKNGDIYKSSDNDMNTKSVLQVRIEEYIVDLI